MSIRQVFQISFDALFRILHRMNEAIVPDEILMSKIYLMRNQKIMLDKDIAVLYDVTPRRLREQVKRNMDRFPLNFMFQLTGEETEIAIAQNAILSKQAMGGHFPYAFTEHGVLMLANVLRSDRAIKMSIRIIEIFIKLKEMTLSHADILKKLGDLEGKFLKHDDDIRMIFDCLKELLTQKNEPMRRIGFDHTRLRE